MDYGVDTETREPQEQKTEKEDPEQPQIVTLTIGPLAGRKYVRLPNGVLGPRWYDDIHKEKP